MKRFFLFGICFFLFYSIKAQSSDILLLKKNLRTIKTFFPGNEITFSTASGFYKGYITSINHDSIFLVQYDVRQMPSNLGVYFLDTIATYRSGVNYKEILSFNKGNSKKFDKSGSGAALFGGGVLITTVGLGTWLFTKPNTRYYASPYLIASSALLAGIGYLILKSGNKGIQIGKKYSLDYIHVK